MTFRERTLNLLLSKSVVCTAEQFKDYITMAVGANYGLVLLGPHLQELVSETKIETSLIHGVDYSYMSVDQYFAYIIGLPIDFLPTADDPLRIVVQEEAFMNRAQSSIDSWYFDYLLRFAAQKNVSILQKQSAPIVIESDSDSDTIECPL